MNHFDVLEISIDDIHGKDEATIKSLVNTAHKKLYVLTIGAHANMPRPDGKTQAQWKQILNEAKATLINPQRRQEHIDDLSQKAEAGIGVLSEVEASDKLRKTPLYRTTSKNTHQITQIQTKKIVGIDLGTTSSAIAHVNEKGEPEIIPNAGGERRTPTVILFKDDVVTVGKTAKQQASAVPEQIVEFVNLEMGKSKKEFSRTFNGRDYSAEELSAIIVKKLKQDAQAYLNAEITDTVITVPAYFGNAEREATRNAGRIAGLNVLRVMNESTAAAVAYGIHLRGSDQNVFVFNLGDGAFDVTIMKVSGSEMQTIATNEDHRLGGKAWDDKIITYVAQTFEAEYGENPLTDFHTYQDIQLNAISAKESLSRRQKARIVCNHNGKVSRVELTREKFDELTVDLIEKYNGLCDVTLLEAEMTWADIDTVLLVGESTGMPMVQEMIVKISGKALNSQIINPDEAVALGAAIFGTLSQKDSKDSDMELLQQTDIDEGATHNLGFFRGKIVSGEYKEYFHVIIPKMTPIPCEVVDRITTLVDDQSYMLLELYQGLEQDQPFEEIANPEAFKLGDLQIELPPKLPKGSRLKITYKYNLHQILEVIVEGPDGRTANVRIDRPTLELDNFSLSSKQ